jgi:hypothetical protein
MKKKKPEQKTGPAENKPRDEVNQKRKTDSSYSAHAIQKEMSRKLKELSARLSQEDNNLKKRVCVPDKLLKGIKKNINDKNLEILN